MVQIIIYDKREKLIQNVKILRILLLEAGSEQEIQGAVATVNIEHKAFLLINNIGTKQKFYFIRKIKPSLNIRAYFHPVDEIILSEFIDFIFMTFVIFF